MSIFFLGIAVVSVHDVWVGTEPCHDANEPGQLCWDAGLSASQQFPFVCFHSHFGQHWKSLLTPVSLACSCFDIGSCCPGAACSLPLHHVRRNHGLVGNCSSLFGQIFLSLCHTFLCEHKSGRGDLKLLQNPAAMSEKYKCILLCIWESFVVEPRRYVCTMDTCSTPWSDPQGVTQSATSDLQEAPTRMRNGSSGSFLLSASKQNSSTSRDKAESAFLLCMAHFQKKIKDQMRTPYFETSPEVDAGIGDSGEEVACKGGCAEHSQVLQTNVSPMCPK